MRSEMSCVWKLTLFFSEAEALGLMMSFATWSTPCVPATESFEDFHVSSAILSELCMQISRLTKLEEPSEQNLPQAEPRWKLHDPAALDVAIFRKMYQS